MPSARVGASSPAAELAGQKCSGNGGNAIDCAIAAFFAAGGATEGVILAPIAALVGGLGMSVRCLDGRAVQAGSGLPRPRGWREDDEIPSGAYVAASRTLPTLALLHAYGASHTMLALSKFGERSAKPCPERAAFISQIGRQGAATLRSRSVSQALLAAAGHGAGGLLCEADLHEARPEDESIVFEPYGNGLNVATPGAVSTTDGPPARPAQVIVASDQRGLVCALAYLPATEGVPVEALGITLPRDGVPVRRGTPRTTPGMPRAAHFPISLLHRPEDAWFAALGIEGQPTLTTAQFEAAHHPSLKNTLQNLRGEGTGAAIAATSQRRLTDSVRLEGHQPLG